MLLSAAAGVSLATPASGSDPGRPRPVVAHDAHLVPISVRGAGAPGDPAVPRGSGPALERVTTPPFPTSSTFTLHSNPTATVKIYLDFTGHTTTGTQWNSDYGRPIIVTPPFSLDLDPAYSSLEHAYMQSVWLRLREDYAPFDVDVTTEDPGVDGLLYSGGDDVAYGNRVVIGENVDDWFPQEVSTGVAYIGGMQYPYGIPVDTPSFVFPERLEPYLTDLTIAEVAAHEAGHAVGLHHDGQRSHCNHGNCEYYYGMNYWNPIMGGPAYDAVLTQWSRGEYPYANNREDDLAILASVLGGYRTDDHASGATTESVLVPGVPVAGLISTTNEVDTFRFTVATTRTVRITEAKDVGPVDANLNANLRLLTSRGSLVATSSPPRSMSASLTVKLKPGTYYVSVRGVADPVRGYSSYDSLGLYTIRID